MLFGIIPVKEADDINIWANIPFVDSFFITLPEQWSMILKPDRTQSYSFVDSLDSAHILK